MIIDRLNIILWLKFKALYQSLKFNNNSDKLTVIVAGNQRSGTNMLMDVLERSLQTDTFHERDPRAFDNYQMRDIAVIRELYKHCRGSHFVIKALCELQDLSQLMHQFAPARVVWIYRHYCDVSNSMMRSFSGFAEEFEAIAVDRDSSGWRGKGMSDETHAVVRSLSGGQLSDHSAAAMQWYYRNILFFEQGLDRGEQALMVSYEKLVTQPQVEFTRIFRFLDLDYTPRVSGKVFSSSIQKHEPPEIDARVLSYCDDLYQKLEEIAAG